MRMFTLIQQGLSDKEIVQCLRSEKILLSRQTVWRFRKHFKKHQTISALPKSGRPSKLKQTLRLIESCMQKDDETTAKQLQIVLKRCGLNISLSTILRARLYLGWSYKGSAYCQMIRDVNKKKRLEWAKVYVGDAFDNVIWTDETTVQLETHKRFCCRKNSQKPRNKPRPKHPAKVHVWGGISWNGRSKLCIFQGIMTAESYVNILQQCLLPSIKALYGCTSHRFMQDNDPKHTSKKAQEFFSKNKINWWQTPPESPDANPIENLWHEMKVS